MDKIILGEEQQLAIQTIINFLQSDEKVFSLMGYAGTGKSTIIKYLIDYLESTFISYVLVAPTHKAKSVLKYLTEREAVTLHYLLNLAPNIEILKLDLRDLMFVSRGSKLAGIPYKGVVICDESSMVGDPLFELLLSKLEISQSKIIFVGDPAQLKPVKSEEISTVFKIKNSFELKNIYRQNKESGLSTILPRLRTSPIHVFKDSYGSEGSLICVHNIRDLFIHAIPSFKKAIEEKNIFEAKFYAYTNERTRALNKKVREIFFPGEEQYYKGEFLTAYENFSQGHKKFWNSMDYIIDAEPVRIRQDLPYIGNFPGFNISLYDFADDVSEEIFILDRNIRASSLQGIAEIIETTRLHAIEVKKSGGVKNAAKIWEKYYAIINSFATPVDLIYDNRVVKKKTFDYGYASTTHKSQGSSINNVFIDMNNINKCTDLLELRQLQYVSLSRARNNVILYQ